MRQRIVISGQGGQGVLTLTRVLAEAAVAAGHEVITTETHGMAQRGAAVVSMVKVGPFHGPLIAPSEADVGLFLHAANLPVHGHFLRPGGSAFVNGTPIPGYECVDADRLSAEAGQPRAANLALLGYAAARGGLFAEPTSFKETIRRITAERYLDRNLAAFLAGVEAAQ